MIKYRVIEEQILVEGLTFDDATTVVEMLNAQCRTARLEKYNAYSSSRLGRDPDLH